MGDYFFDEAVVGVDGGIDGYRVAGMYAGAFDMFHDAGDQYVLSVANRVDLYLYPAQIFVDEHRAVHVAAQYHIHELAQVLF